jgi:polyhydroxyalkanoate synthesis regulator phasin
VLDDLRSYLQMATGLTEATTAKAKEVVVGLLSQGMSLSTKAMPAPEMMGQVQELADDLVSTSRNNREALVGMIRAEVDRAVGRMGFVREDELAALRRHVQRLEKQISDLQEELAAPVVSSAPAPAGVVPAADATPAADEPTEAGAGESAASDVPAQDPPAPDMPKKKKKKIVVAE